MRSVLPMTRNDSNPHGYGRSPQQRHYGWRTVAIAFTAIALAFAAAVVLVGRGTAGVEQTRAIPEPLILDTCPAEDSASLSGEPCYWSDGTGDAIVNYPGAPGQDVISVPVGE